MLPDRKDRHPNDFLNDEEEAIAEIDRELDMDEYVTKTCNDLPNVGGMFREAFDIAQLSTGDLAPIADLIEGIYFNFKIPDGRIRNEKYFTELGKRVYLKTMDTMARYFENEN